MTQSTADSSPPPARPPPSWRAWLLLWLPVTFLLASLLAFNASLDTYLWCATRWAVGDGQYYSWAQYHTQHAAEASAPFYMVADPPMGSTFYHRTERVWAIFKWGGETWMALLIIVVLALLYRSRRLVAAAGLAAVAISNLAGWLIRIVDGRFRPTHHDAANAWELFRGFYSGTDLSFPSGHATAAFANAAVLSYLFPRWRPVFILLAIGTAVARVVQEAHFWSDVLFGSALGWTLGWIVMQKVDSYLRHKTAIAAAGDSASILPAAQ